MAIPTAASAGIRRVGGAVLGLALLASACSSGDTTPTAGDDDTPASRPDWPHAHFDLAGSRTVEDTPIDASSVGDLEVAWSVEVPGTGAAGALATTPVVVDGVVWFSDLSSNVYGVDLTDGSEVLRIENQFANFGPNGVAVGDGMVYAAPDTTSIAAYDSSTGAEVWRNPIAEPDHGSVNIHPLLVEDQLLVATSTLSRPGTRGTLFALDAATGETRWSFDTVESPDLWGMPEVNSGGGAWYPPAVDLERRQVFWGTANPYPWPGTPDFPFGSSRPGDNRWTDSTLALDLDTGELLWGTQHRPHDLFDLDAALAALTTTTDGRRLVISSGKYGRVVAMDADSGAVVFDTPVGVHENDDLQRWEGDIVVYPGYLGGVTTPLAVADGIVFVAVVNAPTELPEQPISFEPDSPNFDLRPGQMVAVDIDDGTIAWEVDLDGQPFGGATVVKDLVLGSTLTGELFALDRATGEQVWSEQLESGINGWPAVSGDTLLVPAGVDIGEGPGRLVAFRLPTS